MLRPSTCVFPTSASVKDESGIPWSISITPFTKFSPDDLEAAALYPPPSSTSPRSANEKKKKSAPLYTNAIRNSTSPPPPADSCARCEACYAYMDAFCVVAGRTWRCSLCGTLSKLPGVSRFARMRKTTAGEMGLCPGIITPCDDRGAVLPCHTAEYELPLGDHTASSRGSSQLRGDSSHLASVPADTLPVIVLCLVDETGGGLYMKGVARVLSALAASLPSEARFGLLTVSDVLGVWDLSSSLPHVRYCNINAGRKRALLLSDLGTLSDITWKFEKDRTQLLSRLRDDFPLLVKPQVGEGGLEKKEWGYALQQVIDLCQGGIGRFAVCKAILFPSSCLAEPLKIPELRDPMVEIGVSISVHAVVEDGENGGIHRQGGERSARKSLLLPFCGLVDATGGGLGFHRLSSEEDIQSMVGKVLASEAPSEEVWQCIMRVRCAPEFGPIPSGSWGGLWPDREVDGIWRTSRHVPGACYGMDIEFSIRSDLLSSSSEIIEPALQVAFAYFTLERREGQTSVVRRLKVITMILHSSNRAEEVTMGADPEVIASSLLQKGLLRGDGVSDKSEGHWTSTSIEKSRSLLSDWAANFTLSAFEAAGLRGERAETTAVLLNDIVSASLSTALFSLVHGLIYCCKVFDSRACTDERLEAERLCGMLDPSLLRLLLCPRLLVFPPPYSLPPHTLTCCSPSCALNTSGLPSGLLLWDDFFTLIALAPAESQVLISKDRLSVWLERRIGIATPQWTEIITGERGGQSEFYLQNRLQRYSGAPSLEDFIGSIRGKLSPFL